MRYVIATCLVALSLASPVSAEVPRHTCEVPDATFRSASFTHWPANYKNDWHWLKAVYLYEIGTKPCHPGQLAKLQHEILLTAKKLRHYLDDWIAPRPHDCRMKMALASHVAGTDAVRRQHVASGFKCWDGMAERMPITSRYVENVAAIKEGLQ